MSEEVWRNIDGYEGLYQVSSDGRVKSLKWNKERILKPIADRYGYLRVTLYAGGKQKNATVHRLVCQAFHKNHDNKPCVNHIDENKTNNTASNLEWCTYEDNNNHGTHNKRIAKTKNKPVAQCTKEGELIKIWSSLTEVGRQTGFSQSSISKVALGKYKQAYNFIWKYVDEVVE